MPTTRGRIVLAALTLFIVYFLFIASPTSQSEREYRQRTQDGLARRHSKLQGDISDQEWTRQTNEKLRAILEAHPYGPNGHKNADVRSDHVQPKYPKIEKPTEKDDTGTGVARGRDRVQAGIGRSSSNAEKDTKPSGKVMARERLQEYLKKPVVIFSKSYCPHSKRAKQLLTQIYKITPSPTIIELDLLKDLVPSEQGAATANDNDDDDAEHVPQARLMGAVIQELLGEITGRRTVPNIMVGMQSIGGNDLIWDLHEKGELVGTFQKLVGKRVGIELDPEYEREHAHAHEHDHQH